MTGLKYPVHPSNMTKFERQNGISVNVLGYENKELFPIYLTKLRKARHEVDLLYLTRNNESHWCFIKNLNHLQHRTKDGSHAYHYCRYCLQGFTSSKVLRRLLEYCSIHGAQHTTLPVKGKDDILKFSDYAKQLPVPFVIYADFEHRGESKQLSHFHYRYGKMYPLWIWIQVGCVDPKYSKPTTVYRGRDVSKRFIEELMREELYIKNILSEMEPMQMTEQDEHCLQNSKQCHICERNFIEGIDIKVRDHCHISGKFRGASYQSFNLNFKYPPLIPVFCHGFSHFDSHRVPGIRKIKKKKKIKCFPKSDERYTSVSLGNLRFLDSYQFLDASLEKLTNILKVDGGIQHFKYLQAECKNVELLLRKGVYSYSYMDSYSRFEETSLPPKADFNNTLTKSDISDQDHQYAQRAWTECNIHTMGEYHDLFLKTDVLLLADIFEHFRKTCLQYYKLDPAHFYTIPGLAWQAALRMSKVELELMTDPDMYLFFENAIRGGLSMITHKYAKANNPLLEQIFNPGEPNSYILYQDCKYLYGNAMKMKLPHRNFQWLSDTEIESFNVNDIPDNRDEGYVLEVDLHYPKELHDLHSDYPLAPEKMEITNDMLSPHTRQLLMNLQKERENGKRSKKMKLDRTSCTKLAATLH